jgi:CelD/BcsL family acetyltransferase involved in cellulose biosynthesis
LALFRPREARAINATPPLAITSHGDLSAIEADWYELARRLGAAPFLRPEWFSAFWAAFEPGEPQVLVARREGRISALLPLARARGVIASPTNWHTPEFMPIAEDATAACSLVDEALRRSRRRLDLSFLPADEPIVEQLCNRVAERRGWVIKRTIERSPYVELEGCGEDFEARLPGKRRRDLRRRRRRLEEGGSVRFECHDGGSDLDRLLGEGFAVEAAGWKGRQRTAVAAHQTTRLFYERIARWTAEAGALRLHFMRLDGVALAFAFCLVDGSSHYVLKIGIDPSYSRFAPGMLLTAEMLASAVSAGLRRYEFLGGDEPYKLVWTDLFHERRRLQLFPRTPLGFAEYLAWRRGAPLAKRVLRR